MTMNGGFTRMHHDITEAIMLRDFTKRQRKILDLIFRLSWGCGKDTAYIPKQRDFTLVGIYEPDIKRELEWLITSQIIEHEDGYYRFNENFDQWQISRVKPFNPEKLSELLSLNLKTVRGNHPQSNDNNCELSETLSQNLVKHEVGTSQNTKFARRELASPKETLKKDKENIILNNKNNIREKPTNKSPLQKNNGKFRGGLPVDENSYSAHNVCQTVEDIARRKELRKEKESIPFLSEGAQEKLIGSYENMIGPINGNRSDLILLADCYGPQIVLTAIKDISDQAAAFNKPERKSFAYLEKILVSNTGGRK